METEDTQRVKKIGAGEKIEVIEKILYGIWLAALGIMVVVCSLERSPILVGGSVRTLCFGLFGMLVLFGILLLVHGAFSSGIRRELLQLAVFAIAAALYWMYCFQLDDLISTNSTMDALVAGGLICAAAMAAARCGCQ
ncbi:MAG: hypothetical protein LUI39_05230 [Lachnospiraceae bacterium]|nr:hypothetical protein [Lachnospiraceae bacterium]